MTNARINLLARSFAPAKHKPHPRCKSNMSSAASVASDDLEIFKSISNPDKVAIEDVPAHVGRSQLRVVEEEDDEFDRVPRSPRSESAKSAGDESDGETDNASSASSQSRLRERSDDEDSFAPTRRASRTSHASPNPRKRDGAFSTFVSSRGGGRYGRETEEMMLNKQSLLHDIERMKLQGVQFSKEWTMDDNYDDMNFEMKRVLMNLDEASQVAMMRNTLQLACTGVEMLSRRFGLLNLEGWSTEMSDELTKQDRTLGRLYRKYWRRSAQSQPEWDLAMAVVGSAGMFHFRKSVSKRMEPRGQGGGAPRRAARKAPPSPRVEEPDSSDDEGLPP